jgi:hypothetical protein
LDIASCPGHNVGGGEGRDVGEAGEVAGVERQQARTEQEVIN